MSNVTEVQGGQLWSASLGRFGPRPGEQTSKTLVVFSNSCVCSAVLGWGLLSPQKYV